MPPEGAGATASGTCLLPGVEHSFTGQDDFTTFVRARRWVRCSADGAGALESAGGIQFNADDTYTLLSRDGSGALVSALDGGASGSVTIEPNITNVFQVNLGEGSVDGGPGNLEQWFLTLVTDSPRQLVMGDIEAPHVTFVPETDAGWPETEVVQPSIGAPLAPPAICSQPRGPAHPATTSAEVATLLVDDWIACNTTPGETGFGHRIDIVGARFDSGGTWASIVHNGIGQLSIANDLPNGGPWNVAAGQPPGWVEILDAQGTRPEFASFYDSPRTVVFSNGSTMVFIRRSDTGL